MNGKSRPQAGRWVAATRLSRAPQRHAIVDLAVKAMHLARAEFIGAAAPWARNQEALAGRRPRGAHGGALLLMTRIGATVQERGSGKRRRIILDPSPDGLSETLVARAEAIINDELTSSTEIILHSHLLIEQALISRIQEKFVRPTALADPKLARLGFAQLLTVYIGLYDPEPNDTRRIQEFNRLRNQLAHTLSDPDELIAESLKRHNSIDRTGPSADELANPRLATYFFYLFFGELLGVRSAHVHDPDAGDVLLDDAGSSICRYCGRQ